MSAIQKIVIEFDVMQWDGEAQPLNLVADALVNQIIVPSDPDDLYIDCGGGTYQLEGARWLSTSETTSEVNESLS